MDNFFVKMFQRREASAIAGVPTTTDPNAVENKATITGGSYESRIIQARNPQTALTVSIVYHAIELTSKMFGVMPVQYQRKDSEKGNFTTDLLGIGKRINYLLQEEPNPISTAASLWEQVTINRLQLGNGFVYIERDPFGAPIHLWLAICGGYDMVNGTYNLTYMSDHGVVNLASVPRQDVLHFPNTFRYMDGFWGIPTLQYAVDELSLIKTQKNQALETAAKGGRVKLLLGEEKAAATQGILSGGMFSRETTKSYAREINNEIYAQDVVALRGLQQVTPISMTSSQMQMVEQLGISYDDLARYYGVPRPLLMLDTNSHYNDYQNATMEFHTRTILPVKTDMEKEIARKLIGEKDYGYRRIHICEQPLLAMDPERQAKVDQLNLQTGAKTVNEIRAEHDMPSVEKGDIVYISTNLAELGSEKLSGAVEPGRPTSQTTNQDEGEK